MSLVPCNPLLGVFGQTVTLTPTASRTYWCVEHCVHMKLVCERMCNEHQKYANLLFGVLGNFMHMNLLELCCARLSFYYN